LLVSPEALSRRLADSVRLHCKVRRLRTIGELAAEAGLPVKRLQKLIDNDPLERRAPSAAEILSLWAVMGANSANSALSLIGMKAEDEDAGGGETLGKMAADIVQSASSLVLVASDGRVNPHEVTMTEEAADAMIENCQRFKAAARRARERA
jgi:hypothetical protein